MQLVSEILQDNHLTQISHIHEAANMFHVQPWPEFAQESHQNQKYLILIELLYYYNY